MSYDVIISVFFFCGGARKMRWMCLADLMTHGEASLMCHLWRILSQNVVALVVKFKRVVTFLGGMMPGHSLAAVPFAFH